MLKGSMTLRCKVSGTSRIKAAPFQIEPTESSVEQITIDCSDVEQFRIIISFREIQSQELAEGISIRISRQLVNRLSFLWHLRLSDPKVTEASFHPLNPAPMTLYPAAITCHVEVSDNVTVTKVTNLDELHLSKLKTDLEQPSFPGESELPLYRLVIRSEDTTEQFFLLYALLLAYAGPTQTSVNQFIRSAEPNVEERHSPYLKQGEPIYTWLRNELAHYPRTQALTLPEITAEMSSHLERLRFLVQTAIRGLPS